MRKAILLIGILILTSVGPATTVAAPATQTEVGLLIGGQWAYANSTGNSTLNLSDLPPVVEVYTATWCSNCVDVEHALDAIENDSGIQQYHIHRAINEVQDPLGSIEVDQRFHDRYGVFAPPVVIFNGTIIKPGSVTSSESLEVEFTQHAQESLEHAGDSLFVWSPISNTSGTVEWALNIESLTAPNGSSIVAQAWIVEKSANFEEGTNGLEDYPHVVRGILELGQLDVNGSQISMSGNTSITLPPAYDGNDLSVHLLYQLNYPVEDAPVENQTSDELECLLPEGCDEDEGSLPGISMISSVGILAAVALLRNSRRED